MGERTSRVLDLMCDSDKLKEKLEEFLNTDSAIDKQAILKELSQSGKTPEEIECATMVIAHMYLLTPLKHPIKKTCTRLMSSMDPECVKNVLAGHIQDFIQALEKNSECGKADANGKDDFICILQGLFGNFPAGVEALNQIIDVVFLYAFDMFMKSFHLFEAEDSSESAQQMLCNATKFLDTLLHHCDTSIHLPSKSKALLVTSYRVIRHVKVAFTTKAHCGALLVMAVVQCPDSIEQEELNSLAVLLDIPPIKLEDNLLTALLQSCSDCYTTRICIFSGIVHTCPHHVISKYVVDDTPVAIYIFRKMLEIAMIRSSIAAEILEISRTLVSLAPLIANIKIELLADIMRGCWDYIWMHLDHFVDAVRTDAQKLLKTVITITLSLTGHGDPPPNGVVARTDAGNPYLQMFTSAISEIIQGRNPNFKALAHIATALKVRILLEIFPALPRSLLRSLRNTSIALDVCVAYERLMEQHKKEMPETWVDTWVKPLLPFDHSEEVVTLVLRIFNAAFKLSPQVVFLLVNPNFIEAEYRALLGCIITARKSNLKLNSFLYIMNSRPCNGKSIFNQSHLQMLICHRSPEIRLLVLTLVVECQKSTAIFLFEDFKLLIMFFRYNASSPFPNFRQSMMALYKKALNRFKDSYYVIQRTIRNEQARGEEAHAEKLKAFKEIEAQYKEFVVTFFHQQLIRGLFAHAEHTKRAMCLELLLHMKTCLPEELYNDQWYCPDYMHMLFGAFNDTYESNLIMLRKLLLGLPKEIVFRKSVQDVNEVLVKPFAQITSDVKSNVVTSATYAILVHIRSPNATELIRQAFNIKDNKDDSAAMLIYRHLYKQIVGELDVAKKDVNIAARYAPVYGLLFFIRHLFQEEQLDAKHPEIIPKLVAQCLTIVEMALPIVYSSAPEGYNPNNVDYEKADVTPQLVLVYAWRTIKEVSLLFGELRINHPKVKEVVMKGGIMKKLAKYFIELFESAKHRGAYEQGYVGFAKLTEKLWNSDCEWAKLPEKWLEDALQLITSTDAKLCATRRSAGIPFLIQGILITEPKHRANKSFHHCMQYLLGVAENYSVENETSAIHSMNILRALYRHNQLGEVVASYVSQGVMISIAQFSHSEWAIRNSATLMFSALMMRMFGVQRLKDAEEISIKNRLAFKVFKTRYADLYEFLFERLDAYVEESRENVSLYPVLVILGRIYLTFDTKKNDKLTEHLNAIIKATTRTIYKIRELAVTATVTFETFLKPKVRVDKISNNQIHGYLLRLKHHMRAVHVDNRTKLTLDLFKPLFVLIGEAGRSVAQTCATLLMDILIEFVKAYDFKHEDLDTYKQLLGYLHTKQEACISTCGRFQETKFTLYLHVILKIPQAQWYTRTFIASALLQALSSRNEELSIYALNCIRYISSDRVQPPETRELEYDFVQTLPTQTKDLLNYIIRVHLIKRRTFMDLFYILRNRSARYGLKVCQVLYNYPSIVYTIRPLAVPVKLSHQIILDYLSRQATSINSDMFVAILGLISKFVAGSNEPLILEDLIDQLEEFGGEDSTVEERLAIANFLLQNYNLLINADVLDDYVRLKLWSIYMELIQDDEFTVRDFCTQISNQMLSTININHPNERYMNKFPLIPERLNEVVLSKLPYFLGIHQALWIYVTLALQVDVGFEMSSEMTIYEKQRPNNYKESRPFAALAKHHLAACLWQLDAHLSYADRTIFLEEHFLLVATRLLNVIVKQDETDDRSLCIAVLTMFVKYLEGVQVGTASVERILDSFVEAFKAAELEERAQIKPLCSCVIEVSQFLSSVLFTCREREERDACKCDNL